MAKYISSKYIGRIPASIKPTSSHVISTAIVFLKFQSRPTKRLDSTKDERHCGPLRESERRGFSGY